MENRKHWANEEHLREKWLRQRKVRFWGLQNCGFQNTGFFPVSDQRNIKNGEQKEKATEKLWLKSPQTIA